MADIGETNIDECMCGSGVKLFRRRYKPDELVHLKADKLISIDDDKIVTQWKVLKPRPDISHGISCYFLQEGFKVSKFFGPDNQFLYWYCDIIETIRKADNEYIFNDLLIDVIIYENGFVKVVDIGDLANAYKEEHITSAQMTNALYAADKLLSIIYNGNLSILTKEINEICI